MNEVKILNTKILRAEVSRFVFYFASDGGAYKKGEWYD